MPPAKSRDLWKHPLVYLHGGPLDGGWIFLPDWEQKIRATERIQELTPHREAPTLRYRRTINIRTHPENPGASGTVWTYQRR